MHTKTHSRGLRLAAVGLIAAPAFLALAFILKHGVNMFFWDRWAMADLIAGMYTGDIRVTETFRQHTNHRPFFSRLAILGLGMIFKFNTRVEMVFSWTLQVTALLVLFAGFWRDRTNADRLRDAGSPRLKTLFLFAPASWLIFTLRQWTNYIWGWQIQVFLALLGVLTVIVMLEWSDGLDTCFGVAVAGGILASFSYMLGLGIWILGVFYLVMAGDTDRRQYSVWMVSTVVSYALFFYSWERPPSRGSLGYVLQHPLEAGHFFVLAAGAPLSNDVVTASVVGVIVLVLYVVIAVAGVIYGDREQTAKWLSLIAFALGAQVMLTLGRVQFGNDAAIISRYVTFTVLGIVGTYFTLISMRRSEVRTFLSGAVAVLLAACIVMGLVSGAIAGNAKQGTRQKMACTLLHYDEISNEDLSFVYHTPEKVRAAAEVLERNNASVWATPDAYPCEKWPKLAD